MEIPNLLWETIEYSPQILFSIEPTQRHHRKSLCHDMAHFHYCLESQFGCKNVRYSSFTQCKSLLKDLLFEPEFLFYITDKRPCLYSFNCNTQDVRFYYQPQGYQFYSSKSSQYWMSGLQFWTLDSNTVFISGGNRYGKRQMKQCYTFNVSTITFVPRENMIAGRCNHGLQKMAEKIFAFGGSFKLKYVEQQMKSAEVYDVVQNSWKNLPDMPEAGSDITCVRVENQILISSARFRLMSYDTDNEAYSYAGQQNSETCVRCIASSKEKLYLFEDKQVFVMTKQCEVLDTITIDNTTQMRHLSCTTNSDGIVFLIDRVGRVFRFDPLARNS